MANPRAKPSSTGPRWTLSLTWWLAMSGLGLVFPFYSLYLRENLGLRGSEIGAVMASLPLAGLIAQPLWGQIADRTGARASVVGVLCLGTAIGYAALGLPRHFGAIVATTAVLAIFAAALMPGLVALSLSMLPDSTGARFGRVRVMGTLGFAVSVGLFPFALRAWEASQGLTPASDGVSAPGLGLLFPLAGCCVLLAAITTLRLRTRGTETARATRGEWRLLLRNWRFRRVLAFTFLTYLFTQGSMVLFPILVRSRGGGIEAISHMWLIMLALEIPLVFYLGLGVARIGLRGVIGVGILASAIRWGVSGFATDFFWIHVAQLLHGVTVWGVILGVPLYVDRVVPERLRSTAQGLLAMIGIGLASFLSNLTAGWLIELFDEQTPARLAGVASLVLALILPLLLPPLPPDSDVEP